MLPLQILLATFGGWVNRHQADAIEYLIEENRILKKQLGGKRLRLTDDQRRRLAAKGKRLGRTLLSRVATIVTPDTILRWHRDGPAARRTHRVRRLAPHATVLLGFSRRRRSAIPEHQLAGLDSRTNRSSQFLAEQHDHLPATLHSLAIDIQSSTLLQL